MGRTGSQAIGPRIWVIPGEPHNMWLLRIAEVSTSVDGELFFRCCITVIRTWAVRRFISCNAGAPLPALHPMAQWALVPTCYFPSPHPSFLAFGWTDTMQAYQHYCRPSQLSPCASWEWMGPNLKVTSLTHTHQTFSSCSIDHTKIRYQSWSPKEAFSWHPECWQSMQQRWAALIVIRDGIWKLLSWTSIYLVLPPVFWGVAQTTKQGWSSLHRYRYPYCVFVSGLGPDPDNIFGGQLVQAPSMREGAYVKRTSAERNQRSLSSCLKMKDRWSINAVPPHCSVHAAPQIETQNLPQYWQSNLLIP